MARDWGRICVVTRLEKMVDSQFVFVWSNLITRGLRKTDGFIVVKDRVAHLAANEAVRAFLKTDLDSIFFLDSDADVGPGYLEDMRTLEDGWEYDIFQGFYTRRGWPPEAIWYRETELGDVMQCLVWKDNHTEDTAMVGLHNTLIRREVFETMREADQDIVEKDYNWFYYPQHSYSSEDGVFCKNARKHGFRVGSTTKVKAGHISRVTTGWDTYHEYLQLSGALDMWQNYFDLVELVADYTGESYDMVIAKALKGWDHTAQAYHEATPDTPEDHRAYYGRGEYLYDLLAWNVSPLYQKIVEPLRDVSGKRVLVIGAGIGGEVDVLHERNYVEAFELPGRLREFVQHRFPDVHVWEVPTVMDIGDEHYDLIVALDVLEHVHPDEFEDTLDAMAVMSRTWYLHNNFKEPTPQAFDHSQAFDAWCERNGVSLQDGMYRRSDETTTDR